MTDHFIECLVFLKPQQFVMEATDEGAVIADAITTAEAEEEGGVVPDARKKRKKKDMNAPVLARDFMGRVGKLSQGFIDDIQNLNDRAMENSYCSIYVITVVDNRAAGEIQFKQAQVFQHGSSHIKAGLTGNQEDADLQRKIINRISYHHMSRSRATTDHATTTGHATTTTGHADEQLQPLPPVPYVMVEAERKKITETSALSANWSLARKLILIHANQHWRQEAEEEGRDYQEGKLTYFPIMLHTTLILPYPSIVVPSANGMYKMVKDNKLLPPPAWEEKGCGLPFTSASFQKLTKVQFLPLLQRLCELVNAEDMRRYRNQQQWENMEDQPGEGMCYS